MPNHVVEGLYFISIFIANLALIWRACQRQQFTTALGWVLILGLILRMYANLDQYLHQWDEKYHALVARNLIEHPFKPTLFANPLLPYDPAAWCCNHIWLHKPPLPLWLMAGSMRLFGIQEWAVRLPSLVLSILAIWITFIFAKTLFDSRTALFAAFLHAINGKLIELGAGRISSDHVETCHIVMFQLGLFFSYKSVVQNKRKYSVLAGIFTGLAFMSKWTPAMMIPVIWLLWMVLYQRSIKYILHQSLIFFISAVIIGAPWLWFIANNYPAESRLLLSGILRVNNSVVESHGGPWYFYIDRIRIIFGELIYIPILIALYVLIKKPRWFDIFTISIWIVIPLLALSATATKRDTYIMIAAPALFILTAYSIRLLLAIKHLRPKLKRYCFLFALLLLLLPVRYCGERLKVFMPYERVPSWMAEVKNCSRILSKYDEKLVLFGFEHNIEAMFYTGISIYSSKPTSLESDELKSEGYRVLIWDKGVIRDY